MPSNEARLAALEREATRRLQLQQPQMPPLLPEDIADAERIARRYGDPDSPEYQERVRKHEHQRQQFNNARNRIT